MGMREHLDEIETKAQEVRDAEHQRDLYKEALAKAKRAVDARKDELMAIIRDEEPPLFAEPEPEEG